MRVLPCHHCRAPAPPRVALYGGAFDPPHLGHAAVAAAAARHVDQLWWLPTGSAAHKDPPVADLATRAAMCRLLARHHAGQQVCLADAEASPSYTADLLDRLRARHRATRFVLVVGADQAASLHRWHRADDLLGHVDLLVATRPGHRLPAPLPPRATLLRTRPPAASSTAVRDGRLDLLDPDVAAVWAAAVGRPVTSSV